MRTWLKTLRENNKLTQEQVAIKSGISRSFYTHIENGSKDPGVGVAKSIGSTLGFNWAIFFDNECHLKEQSKSERKTVNTA